MCTPDSARRSRLCSTWSPGLIANTSNETKFLAIPPSISIRCSPKHQTRNTTISSNRLAVIIPIIWITTALSGLATGSTLADQKPPSVPNTISESLQTKKVVRPDWEKEVLVPLKTKQAEEEAARVAEEARIAAEQAAKAAAEAERLAQRPVVYTAPVPSYTASNGVLTGSLGYANPYGNCVLEPGVNNPGWGNPINWPVLSSTPHIGSTALFYFNHVAVVTGIWSNGDLEVRQQNTTGGQHRYPRSMFRGFR